MYVGSHSSSSVTKTNVSGGEELFVLTKTDSSLFNHIRDSPIARTRSFTFTYSRPHFSYLSLAQQSLLRQVQQSLPNWPTNYKLAAKQSLLCQAQQAL